MRGNPHSRCAGYASGRSIPACAGEPRYRVASTRAYPVYPRVCGGPPTGRRAEASPGVYPRVCGGTYLITLAVGNDEGLSPRVRGNHFRCDHATSTTGSIPACAGNQTGAPRARGRTGLSPRCGDPGASINFAPLIVHVYRSPYRTIDSLADRDRGSLLTLNCT